MTLITCRLDHAVNEVCLSMDMPADLLTLDIYTQTYSGVRCVKSIKLNEVPEVHIPLNRGSSYLARIISNQPGNEFSRFGEVAILDNGSDQPTLSIKVEILENETLVTLVRSHLEHLQLDR